MLAGFSLALRWLAVNWNQMNAYVPGLSLIFFLLQSLGSEFPIAGVAKHGILGVHEIWELIEGFDFSCLCSSSSGCVREYLANLVYIRLRNN